MWLQRRPAHAAQWLRELATAGVTPWQDGALPVFFGYLPRPGLLTDAPDEPVPLALAPLDLGVDAPHLGDALLRPRLSPAPWVDAEGRLHLQLDGLGAAALGAHVTAAQFSEALQILWRSLGYFVPAPLTPAWQAELAAAVAQALQRPFWQQPQARAWREVALRLAQTPGGTLAEPTESPSEIWKLLAGEAEPPP